MLTADAGTEIFRRTALFLGAGLLGIQIGAWFSGSGIGFAPPPALALPFAAGGLLCAFRFHDRWLRAASMVFALQYLFLAAPMLRVGSSGRWLSGGLTATFALLLV